MGRLRIEFVTPLPSNVVSEMNAFRTPGKRATSPHARANYVDCGRIAWRAMQHDDRFQTYLSEGVVFVLDSKGSKIGRMGRQIEPREERHASQNTINTLNIAPRESSVISSDTKKRIYEDYLHAMDLDEALLLEDGISITCSALNSLRAIDARQLQPWDLVTFSESEELEKPINYSIAMVSVYSPIGYKALTRFLTETTIEDMEHRDELALAIPKAVKRDVDLVTSIA